MSGERLTNIQWKQMRLSIGISFLATFLITLSTFFYLGLDFRTLFQARWIFLPIFIWVVLLNLVVGGLIGYINGNRLKKRLEKLVVSILSFERGNYAQRVPELGSDEIGLVAEHLNEMARRIEKQVASLQKLSTEKVEWQESMKQSVISAERQRIARELHDAVSQQLFAISMMTSAVLETTAFSQEKSKKQIEMIEKMAGNAQNEMRALLLHLRPATLEGKGLREGILDLLTEFKEKQYVQMEWKVDELPVLPKGIEDHLFRIVQEGLSNVFRHAKASSVSLLLAVENRRIHLKIVDNGVGFDMNGTKLSSYGLQSIHERVNEIGGVAEVISFPNKGTQVSVKIPIVDEMDEKEEQVES
ncbi:sensor histidine kinase [Bacillus horti]|uniref:Sensor histidine kinase n=1 Tax=Caldalkalibacillus horti TaxID=77523 RepID=A0ABT9W1F8_9BACI|nr:sensor histidine kinase [Bacillus horti]MDQ0167092.1 NarL family two-component system sensor histidine kinase LiaS [Bacillus horti]